MRTSLFFMLAALAALQVNAHGYISPPKEATSLTSTTTNASASVAGEATD